MGRPFIRTIVRSSLCFAALNAAGFSTIHGYAAETRTVEENGVKYIETTERIPRQSWEIKYEDQSQNVLVPKYETAYQTVPRQYQVPITEWVLEPIVVNRWNPFAAPNVQYQYVQRTRWEVKQDSVQVPVIKQSWVNEPRTNKVAKYVKKDHVEIVKRLVPVDSMHNGANTSAIASTPQVPAATMPSNNQFNQFNNLGPSADPSAASNGGAAGSVARHEKPVELPANFGATQPIQNPVPTIPAATPNIPSIPGKFQ